MTQARPATPDDAPEVARLRAVMFTAMFGVDQSGPWQTECESTLRKRIGQDESLAVFVVDADERGALAAAAVGTLADRLPAPGNVSGLVGYIGSVCTQPEYRRRGYSRQVVTALMGWFAQRGCRRVELHAT